MRTKERLIVLAGNLAALAVVVGSEFPPSGFPLDDAWIHALAARTFVESGTLGIVPGLHGAGATSLLFALVLSVGSALGVDPPLFALAVNTAFYLATGQLLLNLLYDERLTAAHRVIATLAFTTAPNFVWFVVSGMEATLTALLSVAAVATWFSKSPASRKWTGVSLGALASTRPEGLALLPLLAVLKRPGTRREWLELGFAPFVAVTIASAISLAKTGHLTPATLEGRRWMWTAPLEGMTPLTRALLLVDDWIDRLARFTVGLGEPYAFWVVLGFALWGGVSISRRPASRALAAWALGHVAIYAVVLPTFGHGGRYQPLVPALTTWLALEGVWRIGQDLSSLLAARLARRVALAVAGSALAAAFLFGPVRLLFAWRDAQRLAVKHVTDTEVGMAKALDRLPRGAVVASFDIGGIGYFSKRPILEIGGLSKNDIVPYLWSGTVGDYLLAHHVDYVVVPLGLGGENAQEPWNFGYRLGLFQDPRFDLEPIVTLESALEAWRTGLLFTMHCAPRQTLYRIRPKAEARR
jgi:hypothetical protein